MSTNVFFNLIHCLKFPPSFFIILFVISVILLCYRGNKSAEAAPLLKSALLSLRCSNSDHDLNGKVNDSIQEELKSSNTESNPSDFIVCDVAGGLSAWSMEIDPNFPIY